MPTGDDGDTGFFDRQFVPSIPGVPLQVATVEHMRAELGDELMERPGRVFFHLVLLCTGGGGSHEIDFAPVELSVGRVVHVRPGQVHRWRFERHYDATIMLFDQSAAGLVASGWPVGPRWFDLDDDERHRAQQVFDLVEVEMGLSHSIPRRDRFLRAAVEMLVVWLGLDQAGHHDTAGLPQPYVDLLDQLEQDPGWSRSVKDRARRLGYSERTLTRACVAATGRTAKQVIDDRMVLEARRLLTHRHHTIAAVARELSFPESSNFTKFFRRTTGETPEAWRAGNCTDRPR